MQNLYSRVAKCGNVSLYKDGKQNAAVYCNGKLKLKGTEFACGRLYIDLKAEQ